MTERYLLPPAIGSTKLEEIFRKHQRMTESVRAGDIGPWINATLVNNWANFDTTTHGPVRYMKAAGVVYVTGLGTQPTAGQGAFTAFVMPAGFRPARKVILSGHNSIGMQRLDFEPGGNVLWPLSAGNAAGAYYSFHAIYIAEQ